MFPSAFGGKHGAQVRVNACGPLREVELTRKIASGPKSVDEVKDLKEQLKRGANFNATREEAWSAGDADVEPPLKKVRVEKQIVAPEVSDEVSAEANEFMDDEGDDIEVSEDPYGGVANAMEAEGASSTAQCVRIPAEEFRGLTADAREALEADLRDLSAAHGVASKLEESTDEVAISLEGEDATAVETAREELGAVLGFYNIMPIDDDA